MKAKAIRRFRWNAQAGIRRSTTFCSVVTLNLTRRSRKMKVIAIIKSRFNQAAGLLPHDDWLVLGWVLATELLLFIFGVRTFQALENSVAPGWLVIWNRWDSIHYLD